MKNDCQTHLSLNMWWLLHDTPSFGANNGMRRGNKWAPQIPSQIVWRMSKDKALCISVWYRHHQEFYWDVSMRFQQVVRKPMFTRYKLTSFNSAFTPFSSSCLATSIIIADDLWFLWTVFAKRSLWVSWWTKHFGHGCIALVPWWPAHMNLSRKISPARSRYALCTILQGQGLQWGLEGVLSNSSHLHNTLSFHALMPQTWCQRWVWMPCVQSVWLW